MPPETEGQVYEVLRLVGGIPLFAGAHLKRLQQSAQMASLQGFLPESGIIGGIRELADANGVYEGNVRLVVGGARGGDMADWAVCFIPHRYPLADDYLHGVDLALMEAERANPHAKTLNISLRARADALIRDTGVYEVLLLNPDGYVTEGSRSNCFFVNGATVHTPPLQQVLPGVTRAEVLAICKEEGFPVVEKPIHTGELAQMDAAFITGTSPGVLPVRRIGSHAFAVGNTLTDRIRKAYEQRVQDYLDLHAL